MSLTLITIYSEASTLNQVLVYKRSALEQGTAGPGQTRQKLHCFGRQSTLKALKSPPHTLKEYILSSFKQRKYFCWNLTFLGSQATSFQRKVWVFSCYSLLASMFPAAMTAIWKGMHTSPQGGSTEAVQSKYDLDNATS